MPPLSVNNTDVGQWQQYQILHLKLNLQPKSIWKCKMPPIFVLTKYEKPCVQFPFANGVIDAIVATLSCECLREFFETIGDDAGSRKIRGWREHDAQKNQKQKISWNGPFKSKFWRSPFLGMSVKLSFTVYTYKGKPFPHPFKRRKKNSHKLLTVY